MFKKWRELSLTTKVMVGMISGLFVGILVRMLFEGNAFVANYITDGFFYVAGQIFITSLKMLVVPLIFTSIICGTCSLSDASTLGRLGCKTLALYMLTTAVAITLAILAALLFEPGEGANLEATSSFAPGEAPSLGEVIIRLFPSNPIEALASGNTLQIIVFSVLFGISIAAAGEPGERIARIFESMNEVMMKLVALMMNLAPYGVFCLMARLFTTIEVGAIFSLLKYVMVLIGVLLLHVVVTYCLLFNVFTRLNPIVFLKKMEDAIMFAFSTASSNATIPVTMETVTHRMGVANRVASFTVPLGSTINMDGTAIMQGVATVFIAQAFSIDLGLSDYLTVIMTATLASIGTAGVPGVGLVMLAMVLQQVGLPVEGIALIMGVDRLLDMIRSAVNVTGDSAVTCIVAKSEGALDTTVFNNPEAGLKEEEIDFHHIR
ncbi:sodium:dicarboxylate symporter [Endozoicomonas montiporae]|uniref:Sodium:dicarboxylate symporter n=1 Tax=Endozoicomonas montiporae TaxID=1027273 RepID=A0A081N7K5_9GAMM|nr:dicarboxylate/amino acid:cation symporter [Endozoicomonas montiporae]KEQ14428.1 sodium:dicarboxylate symporter [Endozoicomonas montiporae]